MRILLGLVVLAGCFAPSPTTGAPCSEGGFCPAGQMCYSGRCYAEPPVDDAPPDDSVDAVDAPIDAAIDACGGNVCQGSNLVGCGAMTTCDYGCLTATIPHCARIQPSNNLSWSLVPFPGGTLTLGSGAHVFDTTAGTLTTGGTVVPLPSAVTAQVVGPMMVLALGTLTMASGATLTVTGSRPLAILADGDVTVNVGALILIGGGCASGAYDPTCSGPGGGHGGRLNTDLATGCGPGQNGALDVFGASEAGGGGGGFGRDGANSGGIAPGEGAHGDACGTSALEPLIGGSGGGAGGISMTNTRGGGRGGGGGGALQITAAGTLAQRGTVDAGGAGGENGYATGMSGTLFGGGGGGGSGGGILLEAGALVVSGSVTANGGGGGGHHTTIPLGHGENAQRDRTCAVGGTVSGTLGSPGGNGGCDQMLNATDGGTLSDRGGGGGGLGRIRFNGRTTNLTGATISGSQTTGPAPTLE
jgi:hypothetical protein